MVGVGIDGVGVCGPMNGGWDNWLRVWTDGFIQECLGCGCCEPTFGYVDRSQIGWGWVCFGWWEDSDGFGEMLWYIIRDGVLWGGWRMGWWSVGVEHRWWSLDYEISMCLWLLLFLIKHGIVNIKLIVYNRGLRWGLGLGLIS
ncbi:hypothetical protein [Candidatus Hodgkinia cicadicola]|uniref:hypothetical protein n=1 Tax=Candidatus Hodgkinia cicadicola TaxID=573658 RepID=UPI0011BA6C74